MGLLASKITKKTISVKELQEISKIIKDRILQVSSPVTIYFFGSAVTGDMREGSDFDIAIIFKNLEDLKRYKKSILRNNLFPDIFVDLLFFSEADFLRKAKIGGVCWEISQKGKILYAQRTKV